MEKIAERPRAVTTPHIFFSSILWRWGTEDDFKYGREVVAAVGEVLLRYPDAEQEMRDAAVKEKMFVAFIATAEKEMRGKLKIVFQQCWDAVFSLTTGRFVTKGRGEKKRQEPERVCQPFMALPRKTVRSFNWKALKNINLSILFSHGPSTTRS
jgi:hypothetical protein